MNAATSKGMKQDLPPKGGYAPFQTERVRLRSVVGAKSTFAFLLGGMCYGMYCYVLNYKFVKRSEIEMRSAQNAVWPLLLAERDRAVLKQMRRNRDEEAELMKNVERWEVGTYYGEPIFFLDDPNQYRDPMFCEHFAHTDFNESLLRSARHLVM